MSNYSSSSVEKPTISSPSVAATPLWHAMTASQVLSQLEVVFYAGKLANNLTPPPSGLTADKVKARQLRYGANQFVAAKQVPLILRFLRQFNNILIYILLCSGIIAIVLQRLVDAAVILAVIVINAIIGVIQEGKAEKALAAIRDMLAPIARVLRDGGKRMIIPAANLVPGDIVIIERGDKVPADLRLLETRTLQIQEAILTGEAQAVVKSAASVSSNAQLAERTSLAYSGTIVVNGYGVGVVVATGRATEVGKIGELLSEVVAPVTPLLEKMNRFGYWLTGAILLLGLATFLIGVLVWNNSGKEMFMAIVGLIVAAVPEGLPPILTIILAIGVTRMARRHAIIRRLPAVETMGAVTVICSDKTGTLTCNELQVEDLVTAKGHYCLASAVQKLLHARDDDLHEQNAAVLLAEHRDLEVALLAGIMCNDAELSSDKNKLYGDPLDQAFLVVAHKSGIDVVQEKLALPRTDLIPYESEHKFMATLHHDHAAGKSIVYVKGAPEDILQMCMRQQLNGESVPLDVRYWQEQITALANAGEKVIALAYKEVESGKAQLRFADIADLTLLAIFGVIDPPRVEVAAAIAECCTAGIKVKMITGDHTLTAQAIAKSIGIGCADGVGVAAPPVLTGAEIDALSDDELAQRVRDVNIYARTSPEHKLRLVRALQRNGEVVAMTGDGVNDAPALRQADIGVAMGEKGTEIAKEAAAMVLADDNFATIVHAVAEGRTIYENLKKAILYVLPTSIAQALVIVVAIVMGWELPITAVQILWVNMITTVALSLPLGFEAPESGVMQRSPRARNEPLLSLFLGWRVGFVSLLLVAAVFVLSLMEKRMGVDLITTRTVAVNMIVVGEIVYLFNCRSILGSVLNFGGMIRGSKWIWLAIVAVVVLQSLFTHLPIMQRFFGTDEIGLWQWLRVIGVGLVVFVMVEIEKWVVRRIGFMRKRGRSCLLGA